MPLFRTIENDQGYVTLDPIVQPHYERVDIPCFFKRTAPPLSHIFPRQRLFLRCLQQVWEGKARVAWSIVASEYRYWKSKRRRLSVFFVRVLKS